MARGKCPFHYRRNLAPGLRRCGKCVVYAKLFRQAKKTLGRCPGHPSRKAVPGFVVCAECKNYSSNYRTKAKVKGRCTAHPKKRAVWGHTVCEACLAYQGSVYKAIKLEVVKAYGGRCGCACGCKEKLIGFLTIDHLNNAGNLHTDSQGRRFKGAKLYRWLKKRGFPKEEFGLRCFNCNCGRGHGECPRFRQIGSIR